MKIEENQEKIKHVKRRYKNYMKTNSKNNYTIYFILPMPTSKFTNKRIKNISNFYKYNEIKDALTVRLPQTYNQQRILKNAKHLLKKTKIDKKNYRN